MFNIIGRYLENIVWCLVNFMHGHDDLSKLEYIYFIHSGDYAL